ncbi:hypothetical protein [Haladaptatus salinisoli]|nr:hypothetical protein [Haladaptatus salinisoli]
MSNEIDESSREYVQHLQGVPDGCGCTEIWEHLSDNRECEKENEKLKEEL